MIKTREIKLIKEALCNNARQSIIKYLVENKQATNKEIAEAFNMRASHISNHLKILKSIKLIETVRNSTNVNKINDKKMIELKSLIDEFDKYLN